jgi:hypothetical protein
MTMRPISTYSLTPLPTRDGEARSTLRRDGIATELIVPGCVLEAQYAGPDGTFLFVTHDIPYEETLEILLLTAADTISDRAWLGGAYTTGNFRDATPVGADAVEFSFFGDRRWRVRVLPRPAFRLPILNLEPSGVHRTFGWTRRFTIELAGQDAN